MEFFSEEIRQPGGMGEIVSPNAVFDCELNH